MQRKSAIREKLKQYVNDAIDEKLEETIEEATKDWLNRHIDEIATRVWAKVTGEQKEKILDAQEELREKISSAEKSLQGRCDELARQEMQHAMQEALHGAIDLIKDQLLVELAGKSIGFQTPVLQKVQIEGLTDLAKALKSGNKPEERDDYYDPDIDRF